MEEQIQMSHVGLILDKEYGDKLIDFAAQMPVWIIDTPTNRPSVESYWRNHVSNSSRQDGVTIFRAGCYGDYIDECLGIQPLDFVSRAAASLVNNQAILSLGYNYFPFHGKK
jgi:hypothetical protein